MNSPTPDKIKKARKDAGLTQTQAAALIGVELRTWQHWEAKEGTKDHRAMRPGLFELFNIKIKVKDNA